MEESVVELEEVPATSVRNHHIYCTIGNRHCRMAFSS